MEMNNELRSEIPEEDEAAYSRILINLSMK